MFTKQERIDGVLGEEQQVAVRFRERPFSVDMRWIANPGRAARLTYVAGRWGDGDQTLALIKPSGVLGLLTPGGVKRDIHSQEVLAESRRSVDHFGFCNTLGLIIKYCELAEGQASYELRYLGDGEIDGRPCFLFERCLPYTGEDGPYPNRRLVVYIDQDWLVPTATYAYADDAKTVLLANYIFTSVEFNVGLNDADF